VTHYIQYMLYMSKLFQSSLKVFLSILKCTSLAITKIYFSLAFLAVLFAMQN